MVIMENLIVSQHKMEDFMIFNFGMVDAASKFIEEGKLQLFV